MAFELRRMEFLATGPPPFSRVMPTEFNKQVNGYLGW